MLARDASCAVGTQWWHRAFTIDEVLGPEFECPPGVQEDAARADALIEVWRKACANGDPELFARRLARDNLSVDQVRTRLTAARRIATLPPPGWQLDAGWIVEALTDPRSGVAQTCTYAERSPVPFQHILAPLVDCALAMLQAPPTIPVDRMLETSAWGDLAHHLLRQLANLTTQPLFERYRQWSKETNPQSHSPEPVRARGFALAPYADFVEYMRRAGLARLFAEKPVLLRLIATLTRQWLDTVSEFELRLCADRIELGERLHGGPSRAKTTHIATGLSDPHNGGHSVYVVHFADGSKAVYKPRDVGPDAFWHDLVLWLGAQGAPIDLVTPRILPREGYGWSEFVAHSPCAEKRDVELYFLRAGAWIALMHVFAAGDMHRENIIASGAYPVPVDLEMILQPSEAAIDTVAPAVAALQTAVNKLADTAIMTGLLPSFARGPGGAASDWSGFSASEHRGVEKRWVDINTSTMHLVTCEVDYATRTNVPILEGAPVGLAGHQATLMDGFAGYAAFLSRIRERLLAAPLLDRLGKIQVRKLLRPTQFYALLLNRAADSGQMSDGLTWSAQLDFTARFCNHDASDQEFWPLLRGERVALAHLNVPLFLTQADGQMIFDAYGNTSIHTGIPGIPRVKTRLRAFDAEEVAWQHKIVAMSFARVWDEETGNAALSCKHQTPCQKPNGTQPLRPVLEQGVRSIVKQLRERAIRKGVGAAWLGLEWIGHASTFQIAPLGFDLYNGAPGAAVFLAAAAQVLDDREAAELAIAALAPLRHNLNSVDSARFVRAIKHGGASGLGSVTYALTVCGNLLGSSELIADAARAVRLFTPEFIAADKNYDVMGGNAGAILGLLKFYRLTGDGEALATAVLCGEHLLKSRTSPQALWVGRDVASQALAGMSHGAAGFALAFAALATAAARQDFATAAEQCIAFENGMFSVTHTNWPDLRDDGDHWPCQWCHGATGIGLARLAMFETAKALQATLNVDVDRAIACSLSAWPLRTDTLCCGNAGNIEFLLEAGRALGRQDLCGEAGKRLLLLLERRETAGEFRWNGGSSEFNLGLFRGLSGIGYAALRQISPELPNVLVWQ